MKLLKSRPAQKLGPSPESTTARASSEAATSSIAAFSASNIAKSSPLCLSPRVSRTSATPSATESLTPSATFPFLPRFGGSTIFRRKSSTVL